MPACAALFLRGDVAPAKQTLTAGLSADNERQMLHETLSAWGLTADELGLDPRWSIRHGMALDLNSGRTRDPGEIPDDVTVWHSDTAQLRWDVSEPEAGYFVADTPRTKLFTGFVRGRTFRLGKVELAIGPTRLDWATVSLVAIDGDGFTSPGRILVTATGWVQNSGMELEDLGGDRVTLGRKWGTEPVLCEGIPAEIVLPVAADRVRLYPLDESGNRRSPVSSSGRDGKAVVLLDPKHQTIWYEVKIR
jgi:hypothetical protein